MKINTMTMRDCEGENDGEVFNKQNIINHPHLNTQS